MRLHSQGGADLAPETAFFLPLTPLVKYNTDGTPKTPHMSSAPEPFSYMVDGTHHPAAHTHSLTDTFFLALSSQRKSPTRSHSTPSRESLTLAESQRLQPVTEPLCRIVASSEQRREQLNGVSCETQQPRTVLTNSR